MFKRVEGATDCEIRFVIRFLNTTNVLPSEIHHQICQVCGDNAITDGMVRKWVPTFNGGGETMHDEVRSRRPSLVNEIWCIRSMKECVTTEVSQFLICLSTFLRFQGLYDIVSNGQHHR